MIARRINRSRHRRVTTYVAIAAALGPCTASAIAQSSGSLTSTTGSLNWSAAPWTMFAGPTAYPTGGGTATFSGSVLQPLSVAMTVDVPISLSRITLASQSSVRISGAGLLSAAADGLTVDIAQDPYTTATGPAPLSAFNGITGGGSAGLTKTGPGTLVLNPISNTYTGGTHINGGTIFLYGGESSESPFGTAGEGNGLSFNTGTLHVQANTSSLTTLARPIFLDAGGGRISNASSLQLSGAISGPGALVYDQTITQGRLFLQERNTNTGPVVSNNANNRLILRGNGAVASASSLDLSGSLALDYSDGVAVDRLGDNMPISSRGATIASSASAASVFERAGDLTLAQGTSAFVLRTNSVAFTGFDFRSLSRQNNATIFIEGDDLGATNGNAFRVLAGSPSLIGAGGQAGSTTLSILPWGVASPQYSSLSLGLLTYGPNGFRRLSSSEYASTFSEASTDNIRLISSAVAPTNATVNALLISSDNTITVSGGPIKVTSGAVVFSGPAIVSAGLSFASAEGVITVAQGSDSATISGPITGTGGVTFASATDDPSYSGGSILLTGANTYSGPTTITSGNVHFSSNVPADGVSPSPFGVNTTPIRLFAGGSASSLRADTNATVSRDLYVGGVGAGRIYVGAAANATLTIAGNIQLDHELTFSGTNNSGSVVVLGNLSGIAGISDDTGGRPNLTLAGNNTFTGGARINSARYILASDSAFGTGPIVFTPSVTTSPTLQGLNTSPRTIANAVRLPGNPLVTPTSTVNFDGAAPLTFMGPIDLNGAASLTVVTTLAPITFAGPLTHGGLTKAGLGALILSNPTGNSYSGITNASNGPLILSNTSGSATGFGALTASVLSGDFTVAGAAIAFRLSPGLPTSNPTSILSANAGINAIGNARFGSSLNVTSLSLEIASPTSYDKVSVAGLLTFSGPATLALSTLSPLLPGVYDLLDFASRTGTATVNTTALTLSPHTASIDTSRLLIDGTLRAIASLPGDYNLDGYIDAADYTVWADHFGANTPNTPGDGNLDGRVDAADYTIWADHFGQGSPPAVMAVPEPAGILALLPALALLRRPRR